MPLKAAWPVRRNAVCFPDSTVHHDAQIRTLHIVRNVFAFTERIPPDYSGGILLCPKNRDLFKNGFVSSLQIKMRDIWFTPQVSRIFRFPDALYRQAHHRLLPIRYGVVW